jgi:hypothetical protein
MLVSAAMMACILHTAPCTPAQLDAVSTAVEHCHATQADRPADPPRWRAPGGVRPIRLG